MKTTSLALLFSLLLLLQACKKDCEVTPLVKNDFNIPPNTPYVLDYPVIWGQPDLPTNNPMTLAGVELGRMLFYEKKLSGDNTMSCGSCHKQENAFADPDQFSRGIDGILGGRNAPAIMNTPWEGTFFWDGRAATLEDQALGPIENPIELHETLANVEQKLQATDFYPAWFNVVFGDSIITSDRIAKAISQFERTLISSNSKFDKHLRGEVQLTPQELNGQNLLAHPEPGFLRGGNCNDCHLGYLLNNKTPEMFKNNGLDLAVGTDKGREDITQSIFDRGRFKVPTLRNIAVTGPYMHDGRFQTLEEVLDHYNDTSLFSHENVDILILSAVNQVGGTSLGLLPQEKDDIIAFLHTLTDSTFLTDPRFSDPFKP